MFLTRWFQGNTTARASLEPVQDNVSMERFLDTYIDRMRPRFTGFTAEAAHEIASAFLAFRFGLYAKTVRECTNALSHLPVAENNGILRRALEILRANAHDRDNSVVSPNTLFGFLPEDLQELPVPLAPEKAEDPASLNLDNALILVYVAALITSEDDQETLEEHRRLIVRMLNDYKKALGLE